MYASACKEATGTSLRSPVPTVYKGKYIYDSDEVEYLTSDEEGDEGYEGYEEGEKDFQQRVEKIVTAKLTLTERAVPPENDWITPRAAGKRCFLIEDYGRYPFYVTDDMKYIPHGYRVTSNIMNYCFTLVCAVCARSGKPLYRFETQIGCSESRTQMNMHENPRGTWIRKVKPLPVIELDGDDNKDVATASQIVNEKEDKLNIDELHIDKLITCDWENSIPKAWNKIVARIRGKSFSEFAYLFFRDALFSETSQRRIRWFHSHLPEPKDVYASPVCLQSNRFYYVRKRDVIQTPILGGIPKRSREDGASENEGEE